MLYYIYRNSEILAVWSFRKVLTMALTKTEMETLNTLLGKADIDNVALIYDRLKLQRTWLSNQVRRSLTVGDKVKFQGRRGLMVTGVVTKVNPKKCIVRDGTTSWNVPLNMLSVV